MTLDERAKELQDQFPCEGLALKQCRIAVSLLDFDYNWLGVAGGVIDLSRDFGETSEMISINKEGETK